MKPDVLDIMQSARTRAERGGDQELAGGRGGTLVERQEREVEELRRGQQEREEMMVRENEGRQAQLLAENVARLNQLNAENEGRQAHLLAESLAAEDELAARHANERGAGQARPGPPECPVNNV